MDIPLRHNFTLSGAWKMLFPSRTSIREGEDHQKEDVEAGFEMSVGDGTANGNVQVDEPEDDDGGVDSDSDDTSSISDVAEHPRPSTLREGEFHQGLEVGALFESGVEDDGAANAKLQADGPEEVDGLVESDSDDTSSISDGAGSHDYSQPRRLDSPLDQHRGPGIKLDSTRDGMPQTEQSIQTIAIQNTSAQGKDVWIQPSGSVAASVMDPVERARKAMAEFEESLDSREEKIERLKRGLGIQIDTTKEKTQNSEKTQDKEPSEDSKAKPIKEESIKIETQNQQEQIFELDAGDLSSEANNDDRSLHDLPNPVNEIAGQVVPVGKVKTPTSTLQESGLGKQQQRERLNAMWRVSSAYVEPIAGITTNPHVQTHDPDCSRHELPDDTSNSGDAPPSHEILPLGTTLQGTSPTLATITQHAMGDPTSLDGSTDSNPHLINSSTGEAPPEAATEVAQAALLEQLTIEQDGQEGSNVGAWDDIAKFEKGLSRFTLRTHILFSIVYAIWIAVLYRFITTAVC